MEELRNEVKKLKEENDQLKDTKKQLVVMVEWLLDCLGEITCHARQIGRDTQARRSEPA